MPEWAQDDPRAYWRAADEHERANGSLYREVEFALPKELSADERKALAVGFASQLAGIYCLTDEGRQAGRGRLDAVIAGLLFMGGLRRSEVAALRWADVTDARDGDGVLLTVRTSKTNQEGGAADVRYLKNGGAKAIRTVRADRPDAAPTDRVVGLSPLQIQRRFTAADRAAGISRRA